MKRDPRYWLFVAALVLVFAWFRYDDTEAPSAAPDAPAVAGPDGLSNYDKSRVRVTMYSLTTCPYCKAMNRELTQRNIPFVEYFIDAEPGRKQELTSKLQQAGFRGGAIGTPIMEVNGVMLPNNPSIRAVLKQLQG